VTASARERNEAIVVKCSRSAKDGVLLYLRNRLILTPPGSVELVMARRHNAPGLSDVDCRGQPHCRIRAVWNARDRRCACTERSSENALVPVLAIPQRSPLPGQSHLRSEAPFLTHLIATAELIPQTRTLRRATPTEAQAAYQSTVQNATAVTGVQVRQNA
jgi:hypothetical protein